MAAEMTSMSVLDFAELLAALANLLLLALWIRAGSAVWRAGKRLNGRSQAPYVTLGTVLTLMPAPLLYLSVIGTLSLPRCYSVAPQALLMLVWPELLTVMLALCASALARRMRVNRAAHLLRPVIAGAVTLAVIGAAVQWGDLHRFPDSACATAEVSALGPPLADGWPALLAFGFLGLAWWQYAGTRTATILKA